MIRCLILDDEQHSIDVLKHHVGQSSLLELIASTTDAYEAINIVLTQKIDLLFLDIHMPEISGMDVAKAVVGRCNIIFTTAYKEYALEGFDLGVVDYLMKPVSFPRFMAAAQKVIDRKAGIGPTTVIEERKFMYVKTGIKGSVIKINFEDIEYIESLKNYTAIFHDGKKTLAYLSLKELEDILPAIHFFRVHKTYIIPFKLIERIDGGMITLKNIKEEIPLGDTYRIQFWEVVRSKTVG